MDRQNDPRSTDELIEIALRTPPDVDGSGDSRQSWEALYILHKRTTREVLETARALCLSDDPNRRRVGADILGQLGVPERAFPKECLEILVGMLNDEDLDVLDMVCVALGHLHQPEAIGPLSTLKNHPGWEIRHSLTFAMWGYEDEVAIQTLIALSQDEDDDVRDWATFGLGAEIDTNTPEIRDALVQRLDDSGEALGEAMFGLARRKDERVLPAFLRELAHDNAGDLILDAAVEMADPRLYPALVDLKRRWLAVGEFKLIEDLDRAIAACAPPLR